MPCRLAREGDLDRIEALFAASRALMASRGNLKQWMKGYPSRALAEQDIAKGIGYVLELEGVVEAYFVVTAEEEPCYAQIEGAWLDDGPSLVMHRLASSGLKKGVARPCFEFAQTLGDSIRADTHRDNLTMQAGFERYGFKYCGIVRYDYPETAEDPERLAYQWCRRA